ncbi:MAG: DUF4830 domain-containing protein [Clostridiales bacterium]|nr:DUF4830 domain-containing protein [Clostridiales bacterium]
MFVFSVRSSKIKLALLIVFVAAAVILLSVFSKDAPAARDGAVVLKAGNAAERVAFLSQFGWEFEEDPAEVSEVIIPAEFDAAYKEYNDIQLKQNLDLTPYAGKRVKRWTYIIKNYPGHENDRGGVYANILVYQGVVIGGDVCSSEVNGFIQGFDMPEAYTVAETTAAGTTVKAAP